MEHLKEMLKDRQQPILILKLESYSTPKSAPTDLEHSFNFQNDNSILINEFEETYRNRYHELHTEGTEKLRARYIERECKQAHSEKAIKDWVTKIDVIEESTKGCLWVLKDDFPTCVSGSEAEKDENHINPRFIVNPNRFSAGKTDPTELQSYSLTHDFRKVNDSLAENIVYKSNQVWSISDISTFLQYFFKIPKKFEDISKLMPQKSVKDIIQLFYLLKYQFKLKKCLRVQARRKREENIKEHTKKIIEVLQKKFPNQEYISQNDLSGLISKNKVQDVLAYNEKYGKDIARIRQRMEDFSDYSKYKESAYGGERISDEGPFTGEDSLRRGSSQWTYTEKMLFIKLYKQHGRDWNEIAAGITTKSAAQARNFFQNYKKKLKLDSISEEQDEKAILALAGITEKMK